MAACIRRSFISISEIVSKSPNPSILKLWYSQHSWHSSNCLQLIGLKKYRSKEIDKTKVNMNHIYLIKHITTGSCM